jgi:hypothetical protein
MENFKLKEQVSNFEPTEVAVWLIANTRYDKCRPVNDIPEVQANFETILKLFLSLGVKSEDIKIAHNSKKLYLKQKNELLGRVKVLETKPETSAEKLLLFVLYAGHGLMRKEHTNIMFNEESD